MGSESPINDGATKRKEGGYREYHPARTRRRDQNTQESEWSSFVWLDRNILTAPAYLKLTPRTQTVYVLFIMKYGAQTQDGRRGEFHRPVTFSPSDTTANGIAKGTFKTAIRSLQEYGFVTLTRKGKMAGRGQRSLTSQYLLSDAWKASLLPFNDAEFDKRANLPRFNDPRGLPKLMGLVEELEDNCIWNQYGQYAIKKWFSDEIEAY